MCGAEGLGSCAAPAAVVSLTCPLLPPSSLLSRMCSMSVLLSQPASERYKELCSRYNPLPPLPPYGAGYQDKHMHSSGALTERSRAERSRASDQETERSRASTAALNARTTTHASMDPEIIRCVLLHRLPMSMVRLLHVCV